MSRLPIPGQDDDVWGQILNDYLEVSHNLDGTLKTSSVEASGAEQAANKGVAGGYAPLDGSTKVPIALLPATTLSSNSDVSISSPTNNQGLIYDSSSGKWINQVLPSAPVTSVAGKTGVVTLTEGDISNLTTDLNATEKTANKGAVSGYAGLDSSSKVPTIQLGGSGADNTKFLRGDQTWTAPPSSPVSTVFGRVGAITAQNGDYSVSEVTGAAPTTSPAFTGTPTAPTAENLGAISAQLATILDINHVFNVKAYGATGNGSTDDTTSVQNAINSAAASPGGIVYIPSGTYLVQPLTLPPGTVLQGVSSQGYYNATTTIPNLNTQSQLKLKSGSTGALISPYDGGTNLSTGVNIFDLALNCNGIAYPAINFPDTGGVTRLWLMERVYIFNVGGSANGMFVGTGNAGVHIAQSEVFNGTSGSAAGGSGILWEGSDGIIEDCWIGFWNTYGLEGSGSTDICLNVRGGGIFNNGFAAVGIGAPGMVLDGLSIDGNPGYGFYIVGYPVVASGIRFTGNSGSNFYIAANGAQVDAIGCRYHGTGTPYMFQTNGNTGLTINDIGTIVESGATFATAYSDYQGVGTIESTALSSSTSLTINSALNTLLTSPSLGPGTWLVTATVSIEFSTSTSTFIDFAGALGTAIGTIIGTPAFALAQPGSSFEFGCLNGTVTFLVIVTGAGTVILEYESTSTGGGALALEHGVNMNLGSSTGLVCTRVF